MANDDNVPESKVELASETGELALGIRVEESYRRNRLALLSYARSCCRDPHTAEDLVSEAFARTLQAVRSGRGPDAAWRPYLLTVVRRVAADWADVARRTELSSHFQERLGDLPAHPQAESGEERVLRLEDHSVVLHAFRSLPERWRTVLWHTAVEQQPATTVSALLGLSASGASSLALRAREGLREAYWAARGECVGERGAPPQQLRARNCSAPNQAPARRASAVASPEGGS
ncbi:RNA polymerase sigma factor [Streptomyces sp.]|uniref:RNA polymerase sigma factor n=1 Tax=Streptomyces sp. TaxID=1931 RepID=UPI0039C92839